MLPSFGVFRWVVRALFTRPKQQQRQSYGHAQYALETFEENAVARSAVDLTYSSLFQSVARWHVENQ